MYSLAEKERRDKLRIVHERNKKRRVLEPPPPEVADRLSQRVWGKTRDEMATGFADRNESFCQDKLADDLAASTSPARSQQRAADSRRSGGSSGGGGGGGPGRTRYVRPKTTPSRLAVDPWHAEAEVNEGMTPYTHTFRDRDASKELGAANGSVSGLKYVPRAVFRGGGLVVLDKHTGRRVAPAPTDGPDRPATVSCDVTNAKLATTGSVYGPDFGHVDGQGRIRQPPYSDPKYFLRKRLRAKEVNPRLRWGPATEMERINDEVAKQGVGFALDPYEEAMDIVLETMKPTGGWRNRSPEKWLAGGLGPKELTTYPQNGIDNLLHSVTGRPFGPALGASLRYVEAGRQMGAPDAAAAAALELGPRWDGTVASGHGVLGSADRVTQRLTQSVSPTHSSRQKIPLPGNASVNDRWASYRATNGRRLYSQSIRSAGHSQEFRTMSMEEPGM